VKKIEKKLFLVWLFLTILFVSNGCSSKALYSTAIDYSRHKAGLIKKSKKMTFGKVSYLENTSFQLPTLVLLHGFGENKDNWNKFVATLNDEYHVIVPDLAGHGESSSSLRLNYSVEAHAKRLKKFLLSKKINKFHLIGNSMGGAVALVYTSLYAHDIKTLTLMDAMGMIKSKSKMMKYIEKTKDNPFFNVCTMSAYDELLNYAFYKKQTIPNFIKVALMKKKCKKLQIDQYMFKALLKNIDNLGEVAKSIIRPTLIIWGDKDKILHVDNAKLFHKYIKNSKLIILKNIGHMPMLEAANKSVRIFNTFVREAKNVKR